ncbi:MAG TPA: amino acid adenylation domain-containing protein, partial [Pyrinomonadaceae bacterium]|nr:amino acid adenylation domain-containing protein [Pyrinomonadaceae bacterium]
MSITNDSLAQRRAQLAARRAALSDLKRQELEGLLQNVTVESSPTRVIPERPRNETPPLSFAQERLWFLDQLEPGSAAYNVCAPFSITGRLNEATLRQSIAETIRRHESLRTTFVDVDGQPVQIISQSIDPHFQFVNIAALSELDREAVVQWMMTAAAQRSFALATGPLLQITLFRISDKEHLLVMLLHHIIFDNWSMDVLLRDVMGTYQSFAEGAQSRLPELSVQYPDFAHWQRQWLQGDVLEKELDFWRRELHDSPQVLNLPTDHSLADPTKANAETARMVVPDRVTEQLLTLSRESETTLFMTLLAAFQILLSRYCGQDDVPVGSPVAGRRWVETEGLIGFFVNTLVLRTKLSGDPSIREVLRRVREVVLEAYTHQELPFEKLVEELQPERSLSHSPLFQVMFDYATVKNDSNASASGLKVALVELKSAIAKFDLTLSMTDVDGHVHATIEYNAGLFERSTIERMLEHYGAILEAMAANPEQRLSQLEMLSGAERRQLLDEWNETFEEYPTDKRINEIFEAQVERTLDSVAIQAQDAQLSYRELNERANCLAHYLRELGVGAESRVGLRVDRSPEMIVGLLGILKAGGAYVPLDPSYPPERVSLMLDDAEAKVLVTHSQLLDEVQEQDLKVVCIDTDWPSIAEYSNSNLSLPLSPANLAYVIYTSGSTGLPKGVAITHSSVVSYITGSFRRFGLINSDRILQFASVSFDVSVEEIFWALTTGAQVVLRNDEMLASPEIFLHECRRLGLTMLDIPTGYWNELVDSDAWSTLPEVRLVAIGGERAVPEKVVQWANGPGRRFRLINAYGPTETTVVATCKELTGLSSAEREISIGRPVANMRAYILDRHNNPVPVGVVGELFLGGANLARGYLGQPEHTAGRFLPDLFSEVPGARLYRTGDLVRRRADGDIEFFGRADSQIKLRGYRIEPGEIESVLSSHDSVGEVAIIAREETNGEKRLVAYVVARESSPLNGKLDFGQLHSYLRKRLPDYMLPSAYVQLDALPLTSGTKVDRRALPAPQGDGRIFAYVAPRTPVEEMLSTIWASVLGIERVGIEDNFFELGGHSLLATRLVSRIRESFAVELPLRTLFEQPTVAELAERIEELWRGDHTTPPPVVRVDRSKALPLSFAQQRLWFLDKLEPESSLYNIDDVVQLQGPLDIPAFKRSLDELIRRHESLRTRFVENDGEPTQEILPPSSLPLNVEDLSTMESAQQEAQLLELLGKEAQQPFDLATGPLLRVRLFRLAEEDHVLAVTMHHIISDEWSMNVLTRELTTLYSSYVSGTEPPLVELPIQYADFAVWQRKWLQGDVLDTQLAYWREQLAGAPPLLEMPTDRSRPPIRSRRGAIQPINIDPVTVERLKTISRRHGTTLFMTVMAGFQALLSRWTGQTDLVVGTPIAGRTRGETEGLIGFFVNMLVLRNDLSGNPTFGEVIRRVRDVCLGGYAHQEVSFEQLVEELEVERDLSRTPLFQVMMVMEQQAAEDSDSADLRVSRVAAAEPEGEQTGEVRDNAKYDLTLTLTDRGDELVGGLKYVVDLFDAETIQALARQLERALAAWAADDSRPIGEVELLTEHERQRVLVEWNKTRRDYEPEVSIASAFERRAAMNGAATALTFEGQHVTYDELNQRANKVAHYLISKGIGAEQVVGVYCERGVEMIVALLGVLKAGAAYLPIEVSYPRERVRFMLDDAGVRIVLTGSEVHVDLPSVEVCALETIFDQTIDQAPSNPAVRITPDNLAYVIYTSGSTGVPKGVMVTHRAVINHLKWRQERYPLRINDRFLHKAAFIFDISVWEIFGTLLAGAGLVLARPGGQGDPEYLANLISTEGVTVVHFGPALLREFVESEGANRCRTLRRLFCGGESLTPDLARLVHERLRVKLHQQYGPTETCIDVTVWDCENNNGSTAPIPIGRPIANTQSYVLDERLELSPVGSPGELNIGGESLARGYLAKPDLTAERFVPDPFGRKPGGRLYRTADRVRHSRDGNLIFLGRFDNQVKVRGYRIETGEIESALREHAGVSHAVVVAREATAGEKQLVAYVAAQQNGKASEAHLNATELRDHLQKRLPDFMMPAFFVVLDEIPLTVTGKVDRRKLPAPDLTDKQTYVAPRTHNEKVLVSIWETVLRVKPVGVADNFFALGGDSIRSLRVIALARECGLNFTHQQFFQHQTIAALAANLSIDTAIDDDIRTEPFSLISVEDRQKLPADVEDAYPLSMLQGGMLFHSEFNRDSTLYHNYTSFHIRAPFNEEALRSALQRLLSRHPVLRTSFDLNNYSVPLQLVHATVEVPVQVEDLRSFSEAEQEDAIARWQADEKHRKVDWQQAPLIRFHVHRREEESFQFSYGEHHAIVDGWSVASMLTELFKTYLTLANGETEPEETPLASSFRDFVALEQRSLASKESEEYWRAKLNDRSILALPRLRSSPAESAVDSYLIDVPVSPEVSDGLKRLARIAGVPIKSVLLAAHIRVMSFLGGQQDVLTGVVSHGRPETIDADRVLGLYLNTLPFRLRLNGGDWIKLARETFAAEQEALPYRYYPMARMRINEGGEPLFETAFSFTHYHVYDSFEYPNGVEIVEETGFAETEFALSADFNLNSQNFQVNLSLNVSAEAFNWEQCESIRGYYSAALAAMAEKPAARYDLQSLLSTHEQQQLLVEWNDTDREYARDVFLHQFVEQHAEQSPDSLAVVFEDEQLTYRTLNQLANQLAYRLRALGAGPEVVVGVCLERSLELVVSLLAVMKAGATYLPLDPSYSAQRLSFMIEDTSAPIVISESKLASQLNAGSAAIIWLDNAQLALEDDRNPENSATPDNVNYVIYTSGSTGIPKGVSITYKSLMSYIHWLNAEMRMKPGDRLLQFAPPGFDVSMEEIVSQLTIGATLVLRNDEMLTSASRFFDACAAWGVTVLNIPTQYWQELGRDLSELPNGIPESLRLVITGGDQALSTSLREWLDTGKSLERIVNNYGPTEATIVATSCAVTSADQWDSVPIGKPISNTQSFILNQSLQPVPVGVAGELYIGGIGLARGYLNRPELTGGSFIPDPFAKDPGARLYRSGDLARYLPDGNIEFLGRIDTQIKLRGFRIELGEIESALLRCDEIRECAVVAREDGPGEKRLVGYVVFAPGEALTFGQMRSVLSESLPDYMVPAQYVVLESMPLTPSDKIDRKALPDPGQMALDSGQSYVAPRTVIEEVLAAIWRHVLGHERIGRDDNFFWLGGHSLLAMQIISRVRESFHVELPVRSIFESPTLAELGERIETAMRSGAGMSAPPLRPRADHEQLPLSYAQQRLWFLDQLMPGSNAYNVPAEMYLDTEINVVALEQALSEVVRRHEALRTTFILAGGQPVQRINPPVSVNLPVVDLSHLSKETRQSEAERLRQEYALKPFDLSVGPLLRTSLIRLDKQEHLFLMNMHHIISDGWSMDVFMTEMETLYHAFSQGQSSPLVELEVQYADYAQWQRSWLQGDVLQAEIDYWKQKLEGAPTLLELGTDRQRQLLKTFRSTHEPIAFSEEVSLSLRKFSREQGASLFMTMMAGFHALLRRYTGDTDILVGTPIAGRTRVEVEPMIGFFVNMIPIRTSFGENPSFRELVKQVRESSFAAYTHQELPFDKLVEELQPKRAPGRNPIFQVILAFNNEGPELEIAKVNLPAGVPASADVKFDLEVHLWDTPQGIRGSFVYSPELFDPPVIARMVDHFQRLFDRALAQPDVGLASLSMLGDREYRQVVEEWNDTAVAFPDQVCVHEVIEQQASEIPDVIALEFEDENISYAELNRRANVLAQRLRQHGVGLETLVGVMLERSANLVVSLIAVAKAGGV